MPELVAAPFIAAWGERGPVTERSGKCKNRLRGIGATQARPTQPSAGGAEPGFAQANGRFDEERL